MNFGKRLKAIGEMVPKCQNLVDVGTDHAYLPVLLVLNKKVQHAVATDIAPGPCHAACKTVEEYKLVGKIEVRQADGLAGVTEMEAETVVIAGMGAGTMLEILQANPKIVSAIKYLVLQPMNDSEKIRLWAETSPWNIDAEDLVEEGNKIYEIMGLSRCDGSKQKTNRNQCYQVSSYLIRKQHPLLKKFVIELLHKYTSLLLAMGKSPRAKASDKYKEFKKIKGQLEEILDERNNSD